MSGRRHGPVAVLAHIRCTQFAASDLPRPDWVPVYPGAMVVRASRVTSGRMPSGFHSLDVATSASFEDVKRFCLDRLTELGFVVVDDGIGPLNPLTAAFLGFSGSLSGRRVATDD